MRLLAAGTLASVALLAAGCGGSSSKSGSASGSGGAASIVPANAVAYVAINTDLKSGQWTTVNSLLAKFPSKDQLLTSLRAQFQQQGIDFDKDVKPALGTELDIAVLPGQASGKTEAVGFIKPSDESKLNALLQKGTGTHPLHEKVGDWTVVAQSQAAIDAVKQASKGQSLEGQSGFSSAMGKLPGQSVAKFFVNGSGLTQTVGQALGSAGAAIPSTGKLAYVTGALVAQGDGMRLTGTAKTNGKALSSATYKSQLVGEAPAGAFVFLSVSGTGASISSQLQSNPTLQQQLPQLEQALGVTVDQIAGLFKNEVAIYVRQGTPIPEITLVAKVDDEKAALATLDQLAARAGAFGGGGAPKQVTISGVQARELTVGGRFSIFWAAFGGKLVVTTAQTGISGLRDSGPRLKDDPTFKDATTAAGLPAATSGFVYLNLKDSIPLLENLAQLGGQTVPSSVSGNLAPLTAFVAYAKSGGSETSFTAFLQVK